MFISVLFAWLTVVFALLAAFKFVARKSGSKKLNQFFHKIHMPFGKFMIVTGVLHGIFAGNPASATLADFTPCAVLFTFNWGTACLLIGIGLALTYVFRKKLKKNWMRAHRGLTVSLLFCLVMHLVTMGITLPSFFAGSSDTSSAAITEAVSAAPSASVSENTSASADSGSTAQSGSVATFSGAALNDGTYEGSASGYSGTTTVSVTVSGGQVTAIEVVSESDSPQFFSRAEAVLDEIISGQTLEVDTVSSATFSSSGLINATYNALQQAVSSGTLAVTSIDLSSVRRGH